MPVNDNPPKQNLRKAAERRQNGALIWREVDTETLAQSNLCADFRPSKKTTFQSVKAQSGELINKGTPVLFANDTDLVNTC